jgi:hypothetical protein
MRQIGTGDRICAPYGAWSVDCDGFGRRVMLTGSGGRGAAAWSPGVRPRLGLGFGVCWARSVSDLLPTGSDRYGMFPG